MALYPLRARLSNVEVEVEVEAFDEAAETIYLRGVRILGTSDQRVITTSADDNNGYINSFFTDVRVGATATDYSIWDDVILTVAEPPPPPPPPPPPVQQLAFLDNVREAAGLLPQGSGYLATGADMSLVGLAGYKSANALIWLSDVTPPPSPFLAFGSLSDEWDASLLSGVNGDPVVELPNRVAGSSIGEMLAVGTPPVLVVDAAGAGRHAIEFDATATMSMTAGADTVDYPLQRQPLVMAFVVQPVATNSSRRIFQGGTTAAAGTEEDTRIWLSTNTANGWSSYLGGQSGALRGGGSFSINQSAPQVVLITANGQSSTLRVNGHVVASPTATVGSASMREATISTEFVGRIFHVLHYSGDTSTVDIPGIEAALIQKWGINTALPTPPVPTNLAAIASASGTVSLTWTASEAATSYQILRTSDGTTPTTSTAVAASVTGTSHTDTGLTNGTQYRYRVRAVTWAGNSALSNEASATPVAGSGATFTDNFTGTPGATLSGRPGVVKTGGSFIISASGTTAEKYTTTSAAVMTGYGPVNTSNNKAAVTVVTRGGANNVGAFCRSDLDTNTFYAIRASSSGNAIELQKSVAGTVTTILTGIGTFAAGDRLEVRADGSTISAYRNGVLLGSVTDTSITTGLYGGIRAGGSTTQAVLDDFSLADL